MLVSSYPHNSTLYLCPAGNRSPLGQRLGTFFHPSEPPGMPSHHFWQLKGQSMPSFSEIRNKCKLFKGPFSPESKSPCASAGCPKKQFSKCILSQKKSIFCFCDLLVRSPVFPLWLENWVQFGTC